METTNTPETPVTELVQTHAEPTVATVAEATPLLLAPATPFYKNKHYVIAIVVAIAILLGAGYFVYAQYYKDGGVVATVNGKSIYRTEYNESVSLIEQAAVAQGIDLNDATAKKEIRDQALNVLINNALLIAGAEKSGFKAKNEDIQKKYDELIAQIGSAEELQKRMAEVGLSEAKLRSNISERILADQFITAETPIKEISVTKEETDAFLATLNTKDVELPPMEELRAQIEAEIRNQKQQKLVADLIEKLRGEAEIVMKI